MHENRLGNLYGDFGTGYAGNVWDDQGIAPALMTMQGGGRQPHVVEIKDLTSEKGVTTCLSRAEQSRAEQSCLVRQATKEGVIQMTLPGVADLTFPDSQTRRGRVQESGQICPTLTTENIPSVLDQWTWELDGELYRIRIRKLTPKECWRLMGFTDEDFSKAEQVNSNTQLYKQAGNSIVKNVLCEVFRKLVE